MKTLHLPQVEYLRERLDYDSETGEFTWKSSPRNGWNGKPAGWKTLDTRATGGYVMVKLDYVDYYAHRLAWKYITGKDPEHGIDHINGIRDDNRFCNLREATQSQNSMNAKIQSNNTSGVKGVSRVKRTGRWKAELDFKKKRYVIGTFETIDQAAKAVALKREELHKEFANHG